MNQISLFPEPTKAQMKKAKDIRVLIGCEESQVVCKEFRALGFNAYSCDLLPCSGGKEDWHIQHTVLEIMNYGWDFALFHPECTRLTVAANKYYKPEYAERFPNIHEEREEAVAFFMKCVNAPIKYKVIENPVGIMSTRYRKPNQIIQPYYFGDTERKTTCLWTYNLPKLHPTNMVEPKIIKHKSGRTDGELHFKTLSIKDPEERRKARSVTFPGIAKAMSTQWGEYLIRTILVCKPCSRDLTLPKELTI